VKTSVYERVMSLVRHALSATANENEAHNAAMLVCRAIQRHPCLLNPESLDGVSDATEPEAPAYVRTGSTSEIHPRVKANLEWETFKGDHGIEGRRAVHPGLCIACGKPYGVDEHLLQQGHVGATHEGCGGWWRDFDFARAPEQGLVDVLV
jgi:hypothetical protein